MTGYNSPVDSYSIAIIGGGHMGRALVGGLIRRGMPPHAVRVGEPDAAARSDLQRDFGCFATDDNALCTRGVRAVVLAVKPQVASAVVAPLGPRMRDERALVISVMAGIRIRSLESWCGADAPVVRAMPNRPALVGAGATGLYATARVDSVGRALAESLLHSVGTVVWLNSEEDLDVVTALSGSGPAYCFLLAELMMRAAMSLGLEAHAARVLAVETLHGSGALAHSSDGDLARLRAEITSQGGTTEAALEVLAGEPGLGALVERAMHAAAQRSRELARQFGAGE
ncbi:MAG TPA: pyrroline-5-carboxylate reductase [Steroidobacteraceae bacterium]|nr:pyrroline-5-carboxylate reductase [Steroidobacteraceae bacterium]